VPPAALALLADSAEVPIALVAVFVLAVATFHVVAAAIFEYRSLAFGAELTTTAFQHFSVSQVQAADCWL
jgi:hypothetical protein